MLCSACLPSLGPYHTVFLLEWSPTVPSGHVPPQPRYSRLHWHLWPLHFHMDFRFCLLVSGKKSICWDLGLELCWVCRLIWGEPTS